MEVLPVSCNEHVLGIEIRVMDTRLRQLHDQLGGAGQGVSARIPVGRLIRVAVPTEQYVREGPGVRHEFGDQIGTVEKATGVYRGGHDPRRSETRRFDAGAVLHF